MNNTYNTRIYEEIPVTQEVIRSIIEPHVTGLNIDLEETILNILNSTPVTMSGDALYYYISDFYANKISFHPDYNKLASRISVKRLHKTTPESYKTVIHLLYNNYDKLGKQSPLISDELYRIVMDNHEKIQQVLDMDRDYLFDYFGIRTLERSYLYRLYNSKIKLYYDNDKKGQIVERPQHMFMRVAIGIHGTDLVSAFETYELMSTKFFTHATPTLFNSASPRPQLSSCFLLSMDDNIDDIFDRVKHIAKISKFAGGIGIDLTAIRARGSIIRGTNGLSDGIIPLCILLDKLGKYINQGGKRNGSIAVYLQPWHSDIWEFCELRKNTGDESAKARDLFMALFVPDLLMKRALEGGMWSLMCPDECPGLVTSYGDEFESLYISYEQNNKYKRQIKAIDLIYHIMDAQIETGMPYILFKDHINRKSNQMNLGTILSSNLCAEIVEYTDTEQIAVCNLASICLPRFLENKQFNFKKLIEVSRVCVRNLNKIIDRNYYPVEQCRYSNMKNRPIGIGVQGLADLFYILKYPFGSPEAELLNKQIFETIYYGCLLESCCLAKTFGAYQTFKGSPFSQGKFQFNLWGLNEKDLLMNYDWDTLRRDVMKYGTRNSLLTALMPTATTSQIMGNSESFEPYMSNIFTRSTLAGDFIVINDKLVKDLIELGQWSNDLRKKIIINNGSVQKIPEIPDNLKEIYKTAFEIKQKDIVKLSAARGPFIDQTQSLNLFQAEPDFDKLMSCLFDGWRLGLKTGMYYLRSRPSTDPIKFGIDINEPEEENQEEQNKEEQNNEKINEDLKEIICKWRPGLSREQLKDCEMCSG